MSRWSVWRLIAGLSLASPVLACAGTGDGLEASSQGQSQEFGAGAGRSVASRAIGSSALMASGRSSSNVTISERANGTTASLSVGQRLTLDLRSLGDGGYSSWTLTAPPDPEVLKTVLVRHVPPTSSLPGDFGRDVFVFEAIAAGRTELVATAARPWKGGGAVTFKLAVVVR